MRVEPAVGQIWMVGDPDSRRKEFICLTAHRNGGSWGYAHRIGARWARGFGGTFDEQAGVFDTYMLGEAHFLAASEADVEALAVQS